MNPRLQQRQKSSSESFMSTSIESPSTQGFVSVVIRWIQSLWKPLSSYVHHHVFLASLSLSLLYFTVLSFGAQMATYLLFVKLTSTTVGLIRTVSVALEISATWIAPWAMRRIGSVRAGLWFINWQLTWVGVAAGTFWWGVTPRWAATGLVVGVVISRVGLWGFDLCVQLIIQEVQIPAHPFSQAKGLTVNFLLGGRCRLARLFFHSRSLLPEFLRTLLLRLDHHLPTSIPVPLPSSDERCCHRHRRGALCRICAEEKRTSGARISVFH